MSELPAQPEPPVPELRASDAERERAAEALRVAAQDGRLGVEELDDRLGSVYTVRTTRELTLLTADVTPAPRTHGHALAGPGATVEGMTVREGPGGSRWIVSIMGGHDRRGRWRVAPRCTVLNVMGGSGIDLNDAELSDRVTEVNMYSVMGGGEIRVPHGVDVQVSEFALMGGNEVELGAEVVPAGGPSIHVRLISIMGGAGVYRGRRPTKRDRLKDKELRKRGLGGELDP